MAQLKAADVESYLAKPDSSMRIHLVYGPDRGLVSERSATLAKLSGVDLEDPFSSIRLDMEELASDPSRLADETNSISMFGGERLIRISGTTRKDVSRIFKHLLQEPPEECRVIIEAGDLKKGVGLRKMIEASKCAMAIPCYPDNDATLARLITQIMEEHDLRIGREASALLRSMLGGDRAATRGEIEKLALYALGNAEVTEQHIREIVGDASSLMVDEVIDNIAMGNLQDLATNIRKLLEAGMSADMVMIFTLRHFQMLHDAACAARKNRTSPSALVQSMRPPVHFSRRDKIVRALSIWNPDALEQSMQRLNQAALDCRKNQQLSESICSTALLAIALKAKHLGTSRR